jgi:rfaE bifunctional protein nucleotidyltransferase chain/domain
MARILSFAELKSLRTRFPKKKIVHCHGVFDLFHYGHLLHLRSARMYGDILVVTVTPDRFVNKGPGRPVYSDQQRAVMIASLDFVDFVAVNASATAVDPIRALRPHVYVKGPDYRDKQKDITGGILAEEDAVRAGGGRLVFTQDPVQSSTELINRYFSRWDDDQRGAIETVRRSVGADETLRLIDALAKTRVLVVGEPIVDSYVFCQAEAVSSKSPTVSARFLSQEDHAGGSLAIANHLASLGCEVTLMITHGGEPYFESLLKSKLYKRVRLIAHALKDVPTPRKTRFLTPFRTQHVFELTNLRHDQWARNDPDGFSRRMIKEARTNDLVIVADFGHGLFEGQALDAVSRIRKFVALNVQTNSGNLGFNMFTKHGDYDYLSIDERECRLAMHDRVTPVLDLARKAVRERIRRPTSITLGSGGSVFFDSKRREHRSPIFFKDAVDTTGAGDAYFTITSLLARHNAPAPLIPFIGNCFAGLKTRMLGNKAAVSKIDLVRTVSSMLK